MPTTTSTTAATPIGDREHQFIERFGVVKAKLLQELQTTEGHLELKLDASKAAALPIEKITVDKATFDLMHAKDRMAHDKLKEGIEGFSKALEDLEKLLAKRVAELNVAA